MKGKIHEIRIGLTGTHHRYNAKNIFRKAIYPYTLNDNNENSLYTMK